MSTIAIVGCGDMGSAVGAVLKKQGHRIITNLSGRSEYSRCLAQQAGFENIASFEALFAQSDLFLSIVPPAAAKDFAQHMFTHLQNANSDALYVDCNAVSPQAAKEMRTLAGTHKVRFQDACIIGMAPHPEREAVRFYTSGPWQKAMQVLAAPQIEIKPMGEEIGRASAIKMAYASLTKGTNALRTAVLLVAEQLGVGAELRTELQNSLAGVYREMQAGIPTLAADAERWSGEMEQIAATYRDAGLTPSFHEGAQWLFERLAETPMAAETRATANRGRSLEETINIVAETLNKKRSSPSWDD